MLLCLQWTLSFLQLWLLNVINLEMFPFYLYLSVTMDIRIKSALISSFTIINCTFIQVIMYSYDFYGKKFDLVLYRAGWQLHLDVVWRMEWKLTQMKCVNPRYVWIPGRTPLVVHQFIFIIISTVVHKCNNTL